MADALVKTPATPKKNAFTSENSQSRLSNASLKEGSDSSAFSSRRQSRVGDNFTDRNALINLEVKVLTQSLGAENQWTECGDGLVEFSDMTIRVIAFKEEGKTEEKVLLEDTINSDTPFVGENCCIVWNSFEQQLSLCLMYASDEGYVASWSALVALQEKSYPPLQFDPLARCKPCKDENGKNLEVFPYSYYLHNKYTPPLGFIHMHAFSVAIMEYEHGRRPELYKNKDVVVTILSIANPELYEYLLDPEVYPLLVNGAIGEGVSPTKRRLKEWTVPGELGKVCASDEKKTQMAKELIGKDLRLSHLLRDILTPKVVSSEVIMRFSSISQRIRNDLTCCFLSADDMLSLAKDALNVIPAIPSDSAKSRGSSADPSSSIASILSDTPAGADSIQMEPAKAEQQLVAHLKFFTNVVTLSINSLGREFVGPIVSKLFLNDLLGTLSLVAERFGMPSGTAATFLSYVSSDNKARVVSIPNYYSPLVEKELALLLDVTLVRLNERQEESVMNELFRGPIVNKPERYNGLLTFMLRQLMTAGIPNSQRKIFTDSNAVKNPYLLYHILGLHDDEGSAAAERVVDAENTNIRTRFQHLVISKYIIHACRGTLSRVPPPPSSATKNISASPSPVIPPAVSSSTNVLTQIPQGITPAFIHILEYLVILSTAANREILLKALFSNKSHVLQYIENCCSVAIKNSRAIGMDVLAANVRFIKAVISCMGFRNLDVDENPLNIFSMPINDPLPKSLVTTICRQLTVERNIFGPLLVAYNSVGGVRKNSVYHSSIFALLDLVETHLPSQKEVDDAGPFNTTLRDVRDFIYLRHSNDMPPVFVKRYSDCMMHELAVRLGREDASCSRSQSVSALSSNSQSESFRSSSKLRFVDEVEAAIGGVDGNCVSPKVSGLSPSAIAAVAHDELQRKRSSKLIEAVVDQFSPSGSFHKRHASDGVTSPTDQLSPPSAANIPRPASGSFSLEDARSPKSMSSSFKSSSLKLDNKDERMEPLKPTAPKTEKPANSFRPRSISSSESSDSTKNGEKPAKENGAVSPSAKSKTANSSPDNAILASSTSSASSDTNVVLPKIKKKSAPSPMKDSHHSSSKGKK